MSPDDESSNEPRSKTNGPATDDHGSSGAAQSGTLVLVVGPSGAGKDTLIDGARDATQHDPRFFFPVRVITRPEGAGENHQPMSAETFQMQLEAGAFFLTWDAHGLRYGLPIGLHDALLAGRTVVVNASRGIVASARALWPRVRVVEITTTADVLYNRLRARGRENETEIFSRIARATDFNVSDLGLVDTIDNSAAADVGIARFVALLATYVGEPVLAGDASGTSTKR